MENDAFECFRVPTIIRDSTIVLSLGIGCRKDRLGTRGEIKGARAGVDCQTVVLSTPSSKLTASIYF